MEYADEAALPDTGNQPTEAGILEPGPETESEDIPATVPASTIDQAIARFPKVAIRLDLTPTELALGRFLAALVTRVLGTTPVNMHAEARRRRAAAPPET